MKLPVFKYDNLREEYTLNGETIDIISEKTETFMESLGNERANILGARLTIEEALLRWYDFFCRNNPDTQVVFSISKVFFRPVISIELKGEYYDPLQDSNDDSGDWVRNVMGNVGLTPHYSYNRGVNTLQLNLARPRINPGMQLLIAIIAGVVFGLLARLALPEETVNDIVMVFLDPVQNLFFKLISAIAGPVIFFTVMAAVCGVGSASMMNKSGKHMIGMFIVKSVVMTSIFAVIGIWIYGIDVPGSFIPKNQLTGTLDYLFGVLVPGDFITPFINTDSPQLIIMAVVIGNAILVLGDRGNRLAALTNQASSACLLIAEWVSRLIPFFVAILLSFIIINGEIVVFREVWKPLILFHVFTVIYFAINLKVVQSRFNISFKELWTKMKPSFMIALKTASVDASFGESRLCLERRLGVDKKLVDYGLPLGTVIYMPASTVSLLVYTLYAAQCFSVEVTAVWLIGAIAMVVALQAASPPVSGVDTLAYAAIFAKLGIPSAALIMAIVCDIIFLFLASAVNQAMLQMELLSEARRLNLLNKKLFDKKRSVQI